MAEASVLFVSTDTTIIATVRRILSAMQYRLNVATSLEEANAQRVRKRYDAILLQTDAPGTNIRSRLNSGLRLHGGPPVLALAKSGSIEEAVRVMRAGASDYLVTNGITARSVRQAIQRAIAASLDNGPMQRFTDHEPYRGFITGDHRMAVVFETIALVAASRATLLIEGESGTGKNLLAHILHEMSGRRNEAFVEVNCGILSDSLIESELFGHSRGAFTSAYRERRGKFEIADGGTVFLDEVGNASPSLQTRLLNAVETGRFERLGDTRTVQSDVRMVVATNVSLEERVRSGRFREDLYHRLNTLKVTLPPLRERVGDIPPLVRHSLKHLGQRHGRTVRDVSAETMAILVRYPWPGNVRELKNVVEYSVVLTLGETVEPDALPERVTQYEATGQRSEMPRPHCRLLKEALRAPERECLLYALRRAAWNKQVAAHKLRISRSTLYKKIKEHGLDKLDPQPSALLPGGPGTS